MIDLKINQELNNFSSFNGIDEAFLPIFISKYLKLNNKLFLVLKDDKQLNEIESLISISNPNCKVLSIPAWDISPYDNSSPNKVLNGQRISTLSSLVNNDFLDDELVILTTFNSIFIKTAPFDFYENLYLDILISQTISISNLRDKLTEMGYTKVNTVRENNEFAVRGDIIDIFNSGKENPIRIYLNNDKIEKISFFDALTQRNKSKLKIDNKLIIFPASEILLSKENIEVFKKNYSSSFDIDLRNDDLYTKILSGHRISGIENYFSLFFNTALSNIFDLISKNKCFSDMKYLIFDKNINHVLKKLEEIELLYKRRSDEFSKFLHPDYNYLTLNEFKNYQKTLKFNLINDLQLSNSNDYHSKKIILPISNSVNRSALEHLSEFINNQLNNRKTIIFCCEEKEKLFNYKKYFEGTIKDKKIKIIYLNYYDLLNSTELSNFIFCNINITNSFEFNNYIFVNESDYSHKNYKPKKSKIRKAENFLKDLNSLKANDFVAHVDHGVGIYRSLEIINISNNDHDCLKIEYSGGDKLFVPVENINLLSKIADGLENRILDKLGSSNWLIKKNKIKNKIDDLANKLITTAANRRVQNKVQIYEPKNYNEFVSNFSFDLTDDQETAIEDTLNDIYSNKLMDRLICGDVGFGKTEVAIRASFVVASSGKQVAIVAPTTILVEQHFKTFEDRFKDFDISIKSLSRMTKNNDRLKIKNDLNNGKLSIVIGTHALLSKDISFLNLGLIVIDEEQHFGVAQKERLKELQFDIHVLTLSATPIPRTLQLSLTGLKDLSLITTPPTNRLAVRTFVNEWDKVTLTDALKREIERDGQIFVVCPRIKDIEIVLKLIKKMSPESKISVAHGRLTPTELEDSIISFYQKETNILISTNIIESGIDIPNANTLIIYNADLFGLSQLYQLRGRVGRSDKRAYAYLTTKKGKVLNDNAIERLKVLKTLDNLGAGFSLANYDLDIRGAGNLLGDEQSGQIRDIGYELYQKMLMETINSLKKNKNTQYVNWSPTITIGKAVLIPEDYVEDLSTRMSLYRKIGDLTSNDEIKNFIEELNERFGPPPNEVSNLIYTISLKIICLKLNINFIDIGPKALIIGFRKQGEKEISKILDWVNKNNNFIKLRNDEKIVITLKGKSVNRFKLLKDYLKEITNLLKP